MDNHYEGHKVQVGNVNPLAVGTSGVMVRKSTPKRAIMSIRRTGLSLFPAYLFAIARASISSVMVNPKPCIIFLEVKATMSPARESMSKVIMTTASTKEKSNLGFLSNSP